MGLSSSSSTTKTTPIYDQQITGAANTDTAAYNANAPQIQSATNQIGSLIPQLVGNVQNGNPAVNAQQNYITGMLGHAPGQNPQLDDLLRTSDAAIGNQTAASLGTRGVSPDGSVAHDVVSRNIAQNDTAARYGDYNQQQQLQAQAAGMAPSNAAGQFLGIAPLLGAQDALQAPVRAATGYASGIGGLLGSYTNQNTKSTQAWGPALLSAASNAAAAFAKGG